MAKSDYVSSNDDQFAAQLKNFKMGIGAYATTLGVTPAQVTAQSLDADYFAYALACQEMMQNAAQQWTAWKDLTRDGGTPPPSGMPVAPTLPVFVAPVTPGIEARFRALVKQIKANANYNSAIGEALGIEGAQQTGPDLSTIQPDLTATLSGGTVKVGWGWGGHSAYLDMIRLEVDRDGKGFQFLANDTTPGYVDTAPFPAAPAKWTYRAIYIVGDAPVGLWSNPVSVMVGG